ncbi:hypothetical protein ALC53_12566 [Atta colombica]|uniref:Uncharacterized protein n=1 Tax=Atta colombica TaxID=520822 RepID=A0A195AYA8_9HYME|nr:hypothetical protein ALC53_12566 [Atta colombica]
MPQNTSFLRASFNGCCCGPPFSSNRLLTLPPLSLTLLHLCRGMSIILSLRSLSRSEPPLTRRALRTAVAGATGTSNCSKRCSDIAPGDFMQVIVVGVSVFAEETDFTSRSLPSFFQDESFLPRDKVFVGKVVVKSIRLVDHVDVFIDHVDVMSYQGCCRRCGTTGILVQVQKSIFRSPRIIILDYGGSGGIYNPSSSAKLGYPIATNVRRRFNVLDQGVSLLGRQLAFLLKIRGGTTTDLDGKASTGTSLKSCRFTSIRTLHSMLIPRALSTAIDAFPHHPSNMVRVDSRTSALQLSD